MSPADDGWIDSPHIIRSEAPYYGGRQTADSMGLVLHCGRTDADLVRYLTRLLPAYNQTMINRDQPWRVRRVSYHFVADRCTLTIQQLVPITHRAWHAGQAGNDWIGIALRGPHTISLRSPWELEALRLIVAEINLHRHPGPPLLWWCRHSDLSTSRLDPGPGLVDNWPGGGSVLEHGLPRAAG